MTTSQGVFGTDRIYCSRCGCEAVMFTSPHINGGVPRQVDDGREWRILREGEQV